ncbi:MAG: translation initiation factor IF-2 [Desulfovibrio sp.]|nr:translation initiation factor IF-2 [Desulfovibrio sp.]
MARQLLVLLLCAGWALTPSVLWADSAYNPRHSGLEPPGGPKPSQVLPGRATSRTPEGGRGYIDAYGNTIDDVQPEEKPPSRRLRPGVQGSRSAREPERPLPDPQPARPMWSFQ